MHIPDISGLKALIRRKSAIFTRPKASTSAVDIQENLGNLNYLPTTEQNRRSRSFHTTVFNKKTAHLLLGCRYSQDSLQFVQDGTARADSGVTFATGYSYGRRFRSAPSLDIDHEEEPEMPDLPLPPERFLRTTQSLQSIQSFSSGIITVSAADLYLSPPASPVPGIYTEGNENHPVDMDIERARAIDSTIRILDGAHVQGEEASARLMVDPTALYNWWKTLDFEDENDPEPDVVGGHQSRNDNSHFSPIDELSASELQTKETGTESGAEIGAGDISIFVSPPSPTSIDKSSDSHHANPSTSPTPTSKPSSNSECGPTPFTKELSFIDDARISILGHVIERFQYPLLFRSDSTKTNSSFRTNATGEFSRGSFAPLRTTSKMQTYRDQVRDSLARAAGLRLLHGSHVGTDTPVDVRRPGEGFYRGFKGEALGTPTMHNTPGTGRPRLV